MESRAGRSLFGRGRRRPPDDAADELTQEATSPPPADEPTVEASIAAEPGIDDELRARREEIGRMEERALRDTESLEIQKGDLDRRLRALEDRERTLEHQAEELKRQRRVQRKELERISGLTVAEAKQVLIADVETEARADAAAELGKIEDETRREAERRARNILSVAMQRLAATHASETTTRTIALPNDEMKGRIIGREGRNIRALENLTGVDIIVDETPNAVVLSSFDGVRREIARVTLEKLIADGRIHPALCEEMYGQAKEEVEARIVEDGERAALEAKVNNLDPELLKLLGRLRYRTSYGQNVLDHLVECANFAAMLAAELGASVETTRRAALLHDIGKAVSHEVEGTHAEVGARLARRYGEQEAVAHAMEAHHNEVEPRTVEAVLVQAADAVSGARPGARGESLEQYVSRLRDLEEIAARHDGVERVLAMRAGREVRVMVDPGEVDDERIALLSHEIAHQISEELEHPGQDPRDGDPGEPLDLLRRLRRIGSGAVEPELFYWIGGALTLAALVVSAIGIRSNNFPPSRGALLGLLALFVVLVVGSTTYAVVNARDEQSKHRAELAAEQEEAGAEELEAGETGTEGPITGDEGAAEEAGVTEEEAVDVGKVAMTEYAFGPDSVTVKSGDTVTAENEGEVVHNLTVVDGEDELEGTDDVDPGQSGDLEVDLDPGTYEMICTIPGHEDLGMAGDFTVE